MDMCERYRFLAFGFVMSVLLLQGPLPAGANTVDGACCLASGVCADSTDFTCMEQGGTFVGADTSCEDVNCRVAAPVMSILGIVGIAGALSGLGAYTLLRRRRSS